MPIDFRLPGARLVSGRVLVCCLAGTGALLALLLLTGRFLHVEDPLGPADAILVFSGTFADSPLEAADLYRAGYAPLIVLTREAPDGGQRWLAQHAVSFPDRADLARDLLVRLGVPPGALLVPATFVDHTSDEAAVFASLIRARHWHRVIAVTSRMHTRRARLALRRAIGNPDVAVLIHASHYDDSDPAHWWRRRSDVRAFTIEVQKYVAYWIGASR